MSVGICSLPYTSQTSAILLTRQEQWLLEIFLPALISCSVSADAKAGAKEALHVSKFFRVCCHAFADELGFSSGPGSLTCDASDEDTPVKT